MPVKDTARRQYARIADQAVSASAGLDLPREGWIRTVRKALGMSGAQLARRMRVTRARIAQAEASELEGGITLKSMHVAAEAMGCRFVYAVIPSSTIESMILSQAYAKASKLVREADSHMALENQAVGETIYQKNIERLANQFASDMPTDLWDKL